MANLLFFVAHPDDAEIFAGGTIARLAAEGHVITVVVATGGELGLSTDDQNLESVRKQEAEKSSHILGVKYLYFLGYHDSGQNPKHRPKNSFSKCWGRKAVKKLETILREQQIDVVFFDDENGIYGHPDHLKAHTVGLHAWRKFRHMTAYVMTVDREHLNFLKTQHLVQKAFSEQKEIYNKLVELHKKKKWLQDPNPSFIKNIYIKFVKVVRKKWFHDSDLGMATAEISHQYELTQEDLDTKIDALAVHGSQVNSDALDLSPQEKAMAFGLECFDRQHRINGPLSRVLHLNRNSQEPESSVLDEIASHPLSMGR